MGVCSHLGLKTPLQCVNTENSLCGALYNRITLSPIHPFKVVYICVTDDTQSSSTVAALGVLWTQRAILCTHALAPLVPSGEMPLSCLVHLLGP